MGSALRRLDLKVHARKTLVIGILCPEGGIEFAGNAVHHCVSHGQTMPLRYFGCGYGPGVGQVNDGASAHQAQTCIAP